MLILVYIMSHRKLTAYQTSDEFYNLFFTKEDRFKLIEYLDNSYCDEMGIIDLLDNTYKVIYHVENKYLGAVTDSAYTNLYNFVRSNIIHPDDLEVYDDLMNPDGILEKLRASRFPNFRFAHFRYKLNNGQYRWVEQAIVTGVENEVDASQVRFYIFDIHNLKTRELGGVNNEIGMYTDERNELTGLYKEKTFFEKSKELLEKQPSKDWCFISLDIEHFKLFDEWFGRDNGNFLLSKIGTIILEYLKDNEGVGGYFGQDDYALLVKYNESRIKRLYDNIRNAIVSFNLSVGFLPAFGICSLTDAKNMVDAFDKSSVASFHAKQDLHERIHRYDPIVHIKEAEEYHTMLDFMSALQNGEITFYLQPQCRISTKCVVGAEALARWIKPSGEVITPAGFVPMLEKYGFIADLDVYLWDKVCAWLKNRIDRGLDVVPVSVNVSQVDIFTIDIVDHFTELVNKYQLSPKYLKIEITESAYAQESGKMRDIVRELRNRGFYVLMDDFGAAYSSLNMLSSLEVDAVKLDGDFLKIDGNTFRKGQNILESIINMTKVISLPLIVEGVETEAQCDFIENLGCRYVQGYYFYRPIPISQFEDILNNPKLIDKRGIIMKMNEQFRLREFLDKNVYSDSMLNSILGPVAIYAWKDERLDIIRFNQQFYQSVSDSEFHERLENIQNWVPDEDKPRLYELLNTAMSSKLSESEGAIRFRKADGVVTNFIIHFFYLGDVDGTHRFYGSATNITEYTDLQQQMKLIAKYSSDTILFLTRRESGDITIQVATHGLEKDTGLSIDELKKELNDRSIAKRIIGNEVRENLNKLDHNSFKEKAELVLPFKVINTRGETLNLLVAVDPVYDEANNVEYILTVRKNINTEK